MADLARIKGNVKKMVSMGAPESDIDAYIAEEGVTIDDVRGFGATTPVPTEGAAGEFARTASAITQNPAKAAYEQLPEWQKPIVAASDIVNRTADGLMFGFGDEIAAGIRAPFTDKTYSEELANQERLSNAERNRAGGAATAAELAGGVKTALAAPSFAANSMNAGHGLLRTAAGSGVDGAILGGLMGLGGTGSMEDRLGDAASGAKWGLGLGAAAPLAVAGGTKLFQKAVSPFATTAERSKAVQTLAREGVETTAGQKTGSKALRYAEGEIGGAKAADMVERQGEQFTQAALKRAGINANRATPEVIDGAFERIGQQFDDLAARNVLKPDDALLKELRTAFNEYGSMVPESARAPIVTELANDIVDTIKTKGAIDGAAYQSLRSRLEKMARGARADPQLSGVLRDFRSALDKGMERSIIRTNPRDAGAWSKARKQYRNMLVLEDAATRAGENAAQGIISPSALRGATKNKQGLRNYARGNGDFADLARAGEAVMKPLPDSGTSSRLSARSLGALGPSIVGAGAGGAYGAKDGGLAGSIAGALAGLMAPRLVGQLMMSKPGQEYLANQLMRQGATPEMRALATRLLTYGAAKSAPALAAP